ncbi:MAG: stage 0 sporulation family protein [Dehalococcoidales bacterium]|jgi:cell fate regulator YaaT (PSP1 superfamily)|nr:stage 0 sporulation family protein [Dehalococcoidales bacterium]MDP6576580.1 stage 0 sporulation family protein [Dehalococcoidales bacterium]|tara:strand:- start:3077 stop:3871 length:795 start_codon:yes stop_codon:yes gene_type:complete
MAEIVGVRFRKAGRVHYFDPADIDLQINDGVIIETNRGLELGRVVIAPRQVSANEVKEPLKPIVRKAEPSDIERAQELESKVEEALIECGKQIAELKLPMKLIFAEYNVDGSWLTFFFSADQRVDFRDLVRRLTKLCKVRVEMRQVGTRDVAKLIGGFGQCGRPLCCASFISKFDPVSIKMVKEQGLPLNPTKLSGVCGRLMCCLGYENEQYRAIKAKLPRKGQRVSTAMGEATVVGSNVLKETVMVELESQVTMELPLSEVAC